ncbi:MAG: BlaI/MecI/CopY family transcriptional regulator [Acidimicrobiales bacterium]
MNRTGITKTDGGRVAQRRPDGALEADVLRVLWSADEPLTPGEVNAVLGGQLAYTTVMTVLTRLWKKGLVGRVALGRAYAYRAVLTESELATQKMTETLAAASDRASVLAGFVGSLSKRDVGQLRRLLGESGGPPR